MADRTTTVGRDNPTKPTKRTKPSKPHPDFPLFPHAAGVWAKKVRGKLHYFGPWADSDAALSKWLDQKDDLLAGRTPRAKTDGLSVRDLCNEFLAVKDQQTQSGEIVPRSFIDCRRTCKRLVAFFGKERLADDLAPPDFEQLKASIGRTCKLIATSNEINRIRSVFKWGYESGRLDRPVRFGPDYKRPSKKKIRREAQQLFQWACFLLAALFLVGVGFQELYLKNADFGQSPFTDGFTMFLWGFGAEATRSSVTSTLQGWDIPATVQAESAGTT